MKTARAWRLKEALRSLYETGRSQQEAGHLLDRWISWARRRRLPAFKRLAVTVRAHRDVILEHFRSGLSNRFIEAMNAQIQAAKARAEGYATDQTLIAISYLLCVRLKHLPHNPWLAQETT